MTLHKPYHSVRVNPKFYDHPEDMRNNRGEHLLDLSANRAHFDHVLEGRNPETLAALNTLWNKTQNPQDSRITADEDQYPWLNPRSAARSAADLRAALNTAVSNLPHHEKTPFIDSIVDELTAPSTQYATQLAESYELAGRSRGESTNALENISEILQERIATIRRHKRALTHLLNLPNESDWAENLLAADIAAALKQNATHAAQTPAGAAKAMTHHPPSEAAEAIFIPLLRRLRQQADQAAPRVLDFYLADRPVQNEHMLQRLRELSSQSMQDDMAWQIKASIRERDRLTQDLTDETDPQRRVQLAERAILSAFQTYQAHQPGAHNSQYNNQNAHLQAAFNKAATGYTKKQRAQAAQLLADAINWRYQRETGNRHATPDAGEDPIISEIRHRQQELLGIEAKTRVSRATEKLAKAIAETNPARDMSATGIKQAAKSLSTMPSRWADLPTGVEFHDPDITLEYELSDRRITARLADLLHERAQSLKGQPSVRDLLRDPAHHRTMTRFLRPYGEQMRLNLMEYLLQQP